MHELSICLNILQLLEKEAAKNHFQQVKKLWLEIGDLTGIEVAAVQFSFPIAAKRTIAEDAELTIISVAGRGQCKNCQTDIELLSLFSPCPYCAEFNYNIYQGNELNILKMEVV